MLISLLFFRHFHKVDFAFGVVYCMMKPLYLKGGSRDMTGGDGMDDYIINNMEQMPAQDSFNPLTISQDLANVSLSFCFRVYFRMSTRAHAFGAMIDLTKII